MTERKDWRGNWLNNKVCLGEIHKYTVHKRTTVLHYFKRSLPHSVVPSVVWDFL